MFAEKVEFECSKQQCDNSEVWDANQDRNERNNEETGRLRYNHLSSISCDLLWRNLARMPAEDYLRLISTNLVCQPFFDAASLIGHDEANNKRGRVRHQLLLGVPPAILSCNLARMPNGKYNLLVDRSRIFRP